MSQKTQKRYVYWSDDTNALAEETVRKHGELMRANGIDPTTRRTPTGEEQINISGVIRFSMLVSSGKIKLPA